MDKYIDYVNILAFALGFLIGLTMVSIFAKGWSSRGL